MRNTKGNILKIINTIKASAKITAIFALIFLYSIHSLVVGIIHKSQTERRRKRSHLISFYSSLGLKVLNISTQCNSKFNHQGILFVGNHLSYLDILILSSIYPSCFVTSTEIKNTPFLGQLCELGGCLYVNRKNKSNIQSEIYDLTNALKNNLNVTIFPEATSTNGEGVLRFRRPLYNSAIFAKTSVVPFCLNYSTVNNSPIHIGVRDSLFWYDDMSFLPHLWNVCKLKHCEVEISFLDEFITHTTETSDKLLAEETHSLVLKSFRPITT